MRLIVSLLLFLVVGNAEIASFRICAESETWVRPSDQIQAKIWNDQRYLVGKNAYEWTHDFLIWYGGTSPQYHSMNLAGLYTADDVRWLCSDRDRQLNVGLGRYVELWILLHKVKQVRHDGSMFTVVVEPTGKGFQFVEFLRPKGELTFRFVTADGKRIDEIVEGVTPGTYRVK